MFILKPDVLLVEDDEGIREAMRDVLQEEGFDVQTAVHGLAALDALQAGARPRLILLDLMMPVMDGWQFMAALSARAELADIPVVVVSAARDKLPEGTRGCLNKPVDLGALFDTVTPLCPHEGHSAARVTPVGPQPEL